MEFGQFTSERIFKNIVESLHAVHNFDIFAVCESSLHEHIPNENIPIHGFSPDPYRADKPPNAHNCVVRLYFNESLPIKHSNTRMFLVVSYRHANQASDDFAAYFSSLNNIIEKIANEKPRANDTNTREGYLLIELAIDNSLEQLIDDPTHIRDDGTQTCIDHIFTNQPHAYTNMEVLSHPERQSKHLIIHAKINFIVPYPPLYKRKVWEYNNADLAQINHDTSQYTLVESLSRLTH